MTPNEYIKTKGLSGRAELSAISGVSLRTLTNWYYSETKRKTFDTVLMGAWFVKFCEIWAAPYGE